MVYDVSGKHHGSYQLCLQFFKYKQKDQTEKLERSGCNCFSFYDQYFSIIAGKLYTK